jgi:hypothetical protein
VRFSGLIAKRWPVVGGVLLVAALVSATWLALRPGSASAREIIRLPNGQRYRFADLSYGTNHTHGPIVARVVGNLPSFVGDFVRKALGNHLGQVASFESAEPTLCFWFDPMVTTNSPTDSAFSFAAMLLDEQGARGGNYFGCYAAEGQPFCTAFRFVPRRNPALDLCLLDWARIPPKEFARVRLPNPFFGHFPQWQPESLPAVKMAGDLEVRVDGVTVSALPPSYATAQVGFTVACKSPPVGAKGSWKLHTARLSDATGNSLLLDNDGGYILDYAAGCSFAFPSGLLWPHESAYLLELEFKLRVPDEPPSDYPLPNLAEFGFRPDELVTFKSLPLLPASATNCLRWTNTAGGIQVVVREFVQDRGGPRFDVESSAKREGLSIDFVRFTAHTGERLSSHPMIALGRNDGQLSPASRRSVAVWSPPSNVTAVDITWVVQKTRRVEFLVKPPPSP